MHDSCCVFWQVRLPNMELIAKAIQLKLDFQSETLSVLISVYTWSLTLTYLCLNSMF